jgi:hypothetical protein
MAERNPQHHPQLPSPAGHSQPDRPAEPPASGLAEAGAPSSEPPPSYGLSKQHEGFCNCEELVALMLERMADRLTPDNYELWSSGPFALRSAALAIRMGQHRQEPTE